MTLPKARRKDEAERRGEHHSSVPIARQLEAEPYASGATTTAGATDAARIDDGISDDDARNQYPRHRKRPRDNFSVGKGQPDICVHGKHSRERVTKALMIAFPHEYWRIIGNTVIVKAVNRRERALAALAPLGKVTHETKP
jgi:hypothetical protein